MITLPRRSVWPFLAAVIAAVVFMSDAGDVFSYDPGPSSDVWSKVTAAIDSSKSEFPDGLVVEVATVDGVVYSYSSGGFTNSTRVLVGSASKWVSATVLLRLVDQGILSLDEKMSDVLVDRYGRKWSGPMGNITLRDLLSQTSGICGDDLNGLNLSDSRFITLREAVNLIYAEQHNARDTREPGSCFWYGSTHFRIAARYAEVKTGRKWEKIFEDELGGPLGWSTASTYTSRSVLNPNPAGMLKANGDEFMRFMVMQLRKGIYGNVSLVSERLIDEQRMDGFRPWTVVAYSPYIQFGSNFHYGLGNWLECDNPDETGACTGNLRLSSPGTFGWFPWIDARNSYAAVIMTKQSRQWTILPSDHLKHALTELIPEALSGNPGVVRTVP